MKAIILSKLISALLTSLVFTTVASMLLMNESYGFDFYFISVLFVGAPAIFLIGIPASILMDKFLRRAKHKMSYLVFSMLSMVAYVCAGFVGVWVYSVILSAGELDAMRLDEVLPLTVFGMLAAFIFAVADFCVNRIVQRAIKLR